MREVDVSSIKILLHDVASVNAWCDVLNCSEKELLKAVSIVGNSAKVVDDYLAKKNKKKMNS